LSAQRLLDHIWVVGPGRLGVALGGLLASSEGVGRVSFVGRNGKAAAYPGRSGQGRAGGFSVQTPPPPPSLILITVPDSSIGSVATDLAALGLAELANVPVLHTSGALSSEVMVPLAARGHPVGSLHPLVSIADPSTDRGRLLGAWYAVEGTPAAISAAATLLELLKGRRLLVETAQKPLYHAGAVFASNYLVVVLAVAERMMLEAGVPATDARAAIAELARGSLESVESVGAVRALTGPVSRGDTATLGLHLGRLSADERSLYSELAREALVLARHQGLDHVSAWRVASMLDQGAT